jgi:hypothetical protein
MAPLPFFALQLDPRKATDDEMLHIATIEDTFAASRAPDFCMCCRKNGTDGLIMPLCCLSYICCDCYATQLQKGDTSCPFCQLLLAGFNLADVLRAPVGEESPNPKQLKVLLTEWQQLLFTVKARKV